MIIPPQTRTLFFCLHHYYDDIYEKFNPKIIINSQDFRHAIFKFKLNLPKFEVVKTTNSTVDWKIYALNDNNKICWMPLPNVYYDTDGVCMGTENPINHDEFKNIFFTSKFTFSLTDQLKNYIADTSSNKVEAFLKFYQNWQDSGKINLIEK